MEPWLVPIRSNMRKIYNKPETLERMEKDESMAVDKIDPEQARKLLENAKNDVVAGVVDREMKEKEYNLALARVAAIK